MTQEQLNAVIYIVKGREIEEITYRDWLCEYGEDETTTPRGVAPRLHVREVEKEVYNFDGTSEIQTMFEIWTWGITGSFPSYENMDFDNREDADLFIFDCFEENANNNWDAPQFFDSEEEAIQDIADSLDKPYEVIERYVRYCEYAREQYRLNIERVRKEQADRKERLTEAVKVEAETLLIDDQYRADIKAAYAMKGMDKNNKMASAMKGLLARNNKEKINSDFWQVSRILTAKVKVGL